MDLQLKILSLNCWGIPVISKDRKRRMEAIAQELLTKKFDIVCLQEVWTDSDYNLIANKVLQHLPYSHYFYSGVVGSGICILSKYPFLEVFFHQWPVNGYVHKIQHGDWFGGKGVGLCTLKINDFLVNVYSAHLHAEYDRNCDEYVSHRVLQAFDAAQFIRLTRNNADLIILAGDLNTEPGDLAYKILVTATNLNDACLEIKGNEEENRSTNECYMNSYTNDKLIASKFKGKRIDYIMYHSSSGNDVSLCEYNHPFPNRVPNYNFSFSDHEAVSACLKIRKSDRTTPEEVHPEYKTVLLESIVICTDAMQRLNYHKRLYWFISAFLFCMLFVTIGMDAPYNFTKMFHIVRFLFTVILCFTLIMATLWNNIEFNAVLAGKTNMFINLKSITDKEKTALL